MPGSNEELKEILKSSVIQWNNGKKHCLAPTCTNRDDTEKKQKSFFEDPTIKIMCYGSTGGEGILFIYLEMMMVVCTIYIKFHHMVRPNNCFMLVMDTKEEEEQVEE